MSLLKRFTAYYRPFMGLFMLDIVIAAFSSLLSILFPLLTRYLLSVPIPAGDYRGMCIIFAVMLAVYVIQAVSNYIRIRWGHNLGVRMENKMREDLFTHIQTLSFSYFDRTKTGTIMSRITNDLFQIAEVAHHGPEDLLISVATIDGAYVLMFMISVPLALVSIIPLPFMLFYGIVFGHRMKEKNRAVRRSVADINVDAENSIQGIREVKSFAQENFQKDKFDKSNRKLRATREAMYAQMASYHAGIGFMRDAYYLVTVAGGAILIALGHAGLTDLLTFVLNVSVVSCQHTCYIVFLRTLNHNSQAFVNHFQGFYTCFHISAVPNHIGVAKIDNNQIVFFFFQVFCNLICNFSCTHLRECGKIIHKLTFNQNAVFTLIWFFHPTIKIVCHVRIFCCFGNFQLFKAFVRKHARKGVFRKFRHKQARQVSLMFVIVAHRCANKVWHFATLKFFKTRCAKCVA